MFPTPRLRTELSLRVKFLLIVLGGAVLPLAVVGAWLTRTAERSGQDLLRNRLDSTLTRVAQEVGDQWVRRRSALLRLAEDSAVQLRLARYGPESGPMSVPRMLDVFADLREATQLVSIRDTSNTPLWVLAADDHGAPYLVAAAESLRVGDPRSGDVITVVVPIYRGYSRDRIGSVEARLRTASVIPIGAGSIAGAGAVLAMFDRVTGASVVPLPFDPSFVRLDQFLWAGGQWLTAHRAVEEPAVDLFAAAPLDAYTAPFQHAATRGMIALLAVAITGLAVATLLTRRVTQSFEQLADAADAVSRGDLDRHLDFAGRDEVGRVARAFNTMTDNIRRMLRELSQRQAAAALGEFASALAHEVRNPLSAMRLNLQHLDEKLAVQPDLRPGVTQALRDIDRLERTVAGALRVARTGSMEMAAIALAPPLDAAVASAIPEFAARAAVLAPRPPNADDVTVLGNVAALEQVFLNLLLNAAQALQPGGRAGVQVERDDSRVITTVWDTGRGMSAQERERAFEPFYSTRAEGSGLGLSVAKRIVTAHGGTIEVESTPGAGTRIRVILPALVG